MVTRTVAMAVGSPKRVYVLVTVARISRVRRIALARAESRHVAV